MGTPSCRARPHPQPPYAQSTRMAAGIAPTVMAPDMTKVPDRFIHTAKDGAKYRDF